MMVAAVLMFTATAFTAWSRRWRLAALMLASAVVMMMAALHE